MNNQFSEMSTAELEKVQKKLKKAKVKFGNDESRDRKIQTIEDELKKRT